MKLILALIIACFTMNAFAISLKELDECPDYAKEELPKSLAVVEKFDEESKASQNLVEIFYLSIYGRIEQSPTCQEVEGMSASITKALKEIKK